MYTTAGNFVGPTNSAGLDCSVSFSSRYVPAKPESLATQVASTCAVLRCPHKTMGTGLTYTDAQQAMPPETR
jgi:hypothetical protein